MSEMLIEMIDTRWGCYVCQRLLTYIELSKPIVTNNYIVQCCDREVLLWEHACDSVCEHYYK